MISVPAAPPQRRLATLAALALVALLVAGCFPRASDIKNLPEASFGFPGSTLVESHSRDGSLTAGGASLVFTYEVEASWNSISTYYHDQLAALGYEQQPDGLTSTGPTNEYKKDSRFASLEHELSEPGAEGQATRYLYVIFQD